MPLVEVTDEEFENEVLNEEGPVLVDFWAPWCGSCKALMPMVKSLSEEFDGQVKFVKVNTEDNPDTAEEYGIQGLPTFFIFNNGEKVDEFEGDELPSKSQLRDLISKYISEDESEEDESEEEYEDEEESEEIEELVLDKKIYRKLKEYCEENETSVTDEIGSVFSYYYEDLEDEDLEEIDLEVQNGKIIVTLSENLYALLEEEAENNSTDVSEELGVLIKEYLSDDEEEDEDE